MTKEQYYQKLEEIDAQLAVIRQKYSKPSEWVKDPEYRRLSAEKAEIREVGYDE